MFFSKTLDKNYKFQNQWLKWLKQIYLKRIILLLLYRSQRFFEVQSLHVKDAILEFISEKNKTFFIKSDFEVEQFSSPKEYLFSEKVIFLFIVGPHFQIVHKNFKIFVEAMTILQKEGVNFEIAITLTDVQLEHSKIWNKSLSPLTKFIGYASREELTKNFDINTILVSTSIVETIGLHVIEALKNGCLAIVPDEPYSRAVYGSHLPTFQTNNPSSLSQSILAVLKKSSDDCRKIISQSQLFFKENEKSKLRHASEIFNLMNSKNEP